MGFPWSIYRLICLCISYGVLVQQETDNLKNSKSEQNKIMCGPCVLTCFGTEIYEKLKMLISLRTAYMLSQIFDDHYMINVTP